MQLWQSILVGTKVEEVVGFESVWRVRNVQSWSVGPLGPSLQDERDTKTNKPQIVGGHSYWFSILLSWNLFDSLWKEKEVVGRVTRSCVESNPWNALQWDCGGCRVPASSSGTVWPPTSQVFVPRHVREEDSILPKEVSFSLDAQLLFGSLLTNVVSWIDNRLRLPWCWTEEPLGWKHFRPLNACELRKFKKLSEGMFENSWAAECANESLTAQQRLWCGNYGN